MRNLIKSLCSCQTQWHLRQLGGARREAATATARRQRQRRQMQLPQACTSCEQRYFIDFWRRFAQPKRKRRSSHTNIQHPNVSMWIWIWEYEYWISESEYEKLNWANCIGNCPRRANIFTCSMLANSIGRLAPTLAFVYDRHIFVINRRMPQLITCRIRAALAAHSTEVSLKSARKSAENQP